MIGYPELEGDEARRAIWLYDVPLEATHQSVGVGTEDCSRYNPQPARPTYLLLTTSQTTCPNHRTD